MALAESTFARAWVRHRASGDPATPVALAARMLGVDRAPVRARALGDALPWLLRPTVRRMLAAAVATLVLGAGGAALAMRVKPTERADAFLTAWRPVASGSGVDCVVARYAIARGDFSNGSAMRPPLEVRRHRLGGTQAVFCLPSQDASSIVYAPAHTDSGGIDLALRSSDGTERRLTHAAGDDDGARWHAGGRLLVFQTGRFDRVLWRSQLAVLDLTTLATRRLTVSTSQDREPTPSPDGARVAFIRQVGTRALDSVCVINFDGTDTRCTGIADSRTSHALSWTSPRHLVGAWQDDSVAPRRRLDVLTGRVEALSSAGSFAMSSSTGQFVADFGDGASLVVYPEGQTEARRSVPLPYEGATNLRWDWPTCGTLVDTLRVVTPAVEAVVGAALRLGVRATDPFGAMLEPVGIRWRVVAGDATVDSLGMPMPRIAGLVRVSADVGGWRGDTISIRVVAANDTVVITKLWRVWPAPQWVPFGDPRPTRTLGPGALAAMSHHGDANYPSGMYTRDSLPAAAGIGVEVLVSAPLTETQWQSLALELSLPATNQLASLDHAVGGSPFHWACVGGLPGGEGASVMHAVSASVPGGGRVVPGDSTTFSGGWHRMRVQLFADGRCGVAMDGRAAILLDGARRVPPFVRVVMSGRSVHTRILVGPLTVWTGIRTDVDWGALSRERVAATERPHGAAPLAP